MEKKEFTVEERQAYHAARAKEGQIANFTKIAKKFKDNQEIEDLLKALMPSKDSSFVKVKAVHALCYALQNQYKENIGKPVKSKLKALERMEDRITPQSKKEKRNKIEEPTVG